MPQLDPSTFVSQLFWLGVCFLALYIILSFIVLPMISKSLEKREETIVGKINAASTFRERAEDLLADYEKIMADARAQAHEKTKAATQAALSSIEETKSGFLAKLNERLHGSEQDLYRARVTASKDIKSVADDLANILWEKLTSEEKSSSKPKRKMGKV